MKKLNKRFSKLKKLAFYYIALLIINIVVLALGLSQIPILNIIATILSILESTYSISIMIDIKIKIQDMKKNKMFINNEEVINNNLSNSIVLTGTSLETTELVYNTVLSKQPLTLNTII